MRFLYPLGLLGLIGVPILIIIYIIKSKYMEQTISSTYIWRLSEKFLKKRKKISKFAGIIALILQILTIVLISLVIAHPVIVKPGEARDYCFILDGSASMNTVQSGTTRFDIAKSKIENMIDNSYNGSTYTLIYLADEPTIIYESLDNEEKAVELLNTVDKTYLSNDCIDTLAYVQYYFNNNNSLQSYLFTDKDYEVTNINLVNVSEDVQNFGVLSTEISTLIEKVDEETIIKTLISGNVKSYDIDSNLTVELFIDDMFVQSIDIQAISNELMPFSFELPEVETYNQIKVLIKNEDSFMEDNEFIINNLDKQNDNDILLISDTGFMLKSIIEQAGDYDVTRITIDEFETLERRVSGYGLYIFDSYNPSYIPTDGSIWTFNLTETIDGIDYIVHDTYEDLEEYINVTYKDGYGSLYTSITDGCIGEDFITNAYTTYGVGANFTTIYEANGLPMIFVGSNDDGQRQAGFGFSIHDTNFAFKYDFQIIIKNLLSYSMPPILEKNIYVAGDTLNVNVLSGCTSIKAISPSGNLSYMNVKTDISDLVLTEAGTYILKVAFGSEKEGNYEEKIFNIFVQSPEEEKIKLEEIPLYTITGEAETNYRDGIYDNLMFVYILLAIVFVADWMVYCYEQYQLR
ncbi:MAG: BatA and WFA domain-containing protein [Acholeplasmatales bacterium]|nr:BatA and WFA domain-containing protein [Acholeplasmatales bacterium]